MLPLSHLGCGCQSLRLKKVRGEATPASTPALFRSSAADPHCPPPGSPSLGRGATVQEARPSGVVGIEGDDDGGDGAVCDGLRFPDGGIVAQVGKRVKSEG
jgi:hypothetical protein